jgi:hypothetical protein
MSTSHVSGNTHKHIIGGDHPPKRHQHTNPKLLVTVEKKVVMEVLRRVRQRVSKL